MRKLISRVYSLTDNRLFRGLALVLALLMAGCIFWEPRRFAASTSLITIEQGFALIWAVCAGVIHGVGFRLRNVLWQLVFNPLLAILFLSVGLVYFFINI